MVEEAFTEVEALMAVGAFTAEAVSMEAAGASEAVTILAAVSAADLRAVTEWAGVLTVGSAGRAACQDAAVGPRAVAASARSDVVQQAVARERTMAGGTPSVAPAVIRVSLGDAVLGVQAHPTSPPEMADFPGRMMDNGIPLATPVAPRALAERGIPAVWQLQISPVEEQVLKAAGTLLAHREEHRRVLAVVSLTHTLAIRLSVARLFLGSISGTLILGLSETRDLGMALPCSAVRTSTPSVASMDTRRSFLEGSAIHLFSTDPVSAGVVSVGEASGPALGWGSLAEALAGAVGDGVSA